MVQLLWWRRMNFLLQVQTCCWSWPWEFSLTGSRCLCSLISTKHLSGFRSREKFWRNENWHSWAPRRIWRLSRQLWALLEPIRHSMQVWQLLLGPHSPQVCTYYYICVCMYVCIYITMYMCVYIYICTYVMYILYNYIYIYIKTMFSLTLIFVWWISYHITSRILQAVPWRGHWHLAHQGARCPPSQNLTSSSRPHSTMGPNMSHSHQTSFAMQIGGWRWNSWLVQ